MSGAATTSATNGGPTRARATERRCGRCRHFVADAVALERAWPALLALSSAQGDSRGDQGVCSIHGCWLLPRMSCERFCPTC